MKSTKKALLFAIVVFVAASVLIARGISLPEVIAFARSLKQVWWLPLAYLAAYAVLDVFCIPTQVLSIIAPIVWGWMAGGAIELVAATIGAIPPFLISRRLKPAGQPAEVRVPESFSLLLVFRLVPVVPYSILNYVAGRSGIRLPQYVLATAIGIVPSTFIFAYFVDSVAAGVMQPSQVFARVLIAGALLAAFIVVIRLLARRGAGRDREGVPRGGGDLERR